MDGSSEVILYDRGNDQSHIKVPLPVYEWITNDFLKYWLSLEKFGTKSYIQDGRIKVYSNSPKEINQRLQGALSLYLNDKYGKETPLGFAIAKLEPQQLNNISFSPEEKLIISEGGIKREVKIRDNEIVINGKPQGKGKASRLNETSFIMLQILSDGTLGIHNQSIDNVEFLYRIEATDKAALANVAQPNAFPGGIDLNTANGMHWKVSKDGTGVEMTIDPAMIEKFKREGIESLTPVIFKITPITNIWPLVGLEAPRKEERLAGLV